VSAMRSLVLALFVLVLAPAATADAACLRIWP
jgi:hypothetical protein